MDQITALGQHLVTGFRGAEMTEEFRQCVRDHKIGNVILFQFNVVNKTQLKALCNDITAFVTQVTGYPPLISIDQEGGCVSRLKEDATIFPSAMAFSAGGSLQAVREAGRIAAEELRAMGVNFNLAPVMDVNSNAHNPVIGVRSYGDDPATVAKFGCAMAQGLMEGGVLCSLKHFPGHGDTAVDSHLGLPKVEKSLAELEACELIPFQAAIDQGVSSVMTTHILFPTLEPEPIPATMSRRIITDLLKTKMGFQGLVVSDCMMMGAIAKYYGVVEGSIAAIRAGVDLVFVSHSTDLASQVVDAMVEGIKQGTIDEAELALSTEKILQAKEALLTNSLPLEQVGCTKHRLASEHATRAAITPVSQAPFSLGARPLFLGCYRFLPTMVSSLDDTTLSFPLTMQRLLGGEAIATSQDPTLEEIANVLVHADQYTSIVVGTYNGSMCPGQLQLVHAAAATGLPVCAVALRNPYDLADLPENVCSFAAYDYDARTLPIVAEIISGQNCATGKLPVRLR